MKSLLIIVLSFGLASANPFLAKVMESTEYYSVTDDSVQCDSVPENLMVGQPILDTCSESQPQTRMCFCMKKPEVMITFMRDNFPEMLSKYDETTGFMNVCGTCQDPCSLKFIPDDMAELGQKMVGLAFKRFGGLFGGGNGGNPMALVLRVLQMVMGQGNNSL
ncbi:uncharacterized protein LOC131889574 [Tigriopus californicus]|nr:uncharacterized protein LOC131889574 [Tigriopus californicus]|eukprot:TCALIF_13545-PA protein Name:"Protein of unknown function" AED:0.00 eAED:0.00 QI:26/1/1/1/1/1/2/1072/162